MSARIPFQVVIAGIGQTGKTVTLHRYSTGDLIGAFTDDGGGNYHYDHTTTEKCLIKVDGVVVTVVNGSMVLADDIVKDGDLASTSAGLGASLVGVEDGAGRFSGTTVEAILDEIRTAAELSYDGAGYGAALVGSNDAGGYFAGGTVEAILQEIGAITSLLTGLTATAAELNKLDGASADVTAAHLNTLCAGDQSDGGALHSHNMGELLGNILQAAGQYTVDLILRPQFGQNGNGNIFLDVFNDGISTKVYIKEADENEAAVSFEVATMKHLGDLNFLGFPVIGSVAGNGAISNALKLLANASLAASSRAGFSRLIVWTAAMATDPATTDMWTEDSSAFTLIHGWGFTQTPDMRYLRMRGMAKVDSGGSGRLHFEATGATTGDALADVTETVYTEFALDIDLQAQMPVTVPTWVKLRFYMGDSDDSHVLYVNGEVAIWVEK